MSASLAPERPNDPAAAREPALVERPGTATPGPTSPAAGLSEAEVAERRRAGLSNDVPVSVSRSYRDILTANVLNPINLTLFAIGVVMIAIGRSGDALSGVGIVGFNIAVGLLQEIRAKRQLDRIALLTRPRVTVLRDGRERRVDPAELVLGDVVVVAPGDQLVVDGVVVGPGRVDLDESLLTGESDLVAKSGGDLVLSGSVCVAGSARVEATRVGKESYANQLTARARQFKVVHTPLQREVNVILRGLVLLAVFIGGSVWIGSILAPAPLARQLQKASIVVGLVPNGLLLTIVVAYAVGAVRIVRRGALVQQSNAVESLSNVTVLCTDKTGTLTANKIDYHAACPVAISSAELEQLLGEFAHSTSAANKTTEALRSALPGAHRPLSDEVPFSSARKWSAIACREAPLDGVYVLGAWEMLAPHMQAVSAGEPALRQLEDWSEQGLRVLAFAHQPAASALPRFDGQPGLPELALLGVVSLRDELRPHLEDTLADFAASGVALKIISGDSPKTVTALARQAGLKGDLAGVSGPELARMDPAQFRQAAAGATIYGRISPEQKEQLVAALRAQGQYVAMVGDGVNDVLSLKQANLGIAMESGSAATRGVADLILLGDTFEALPAALREGQRIVNGMKDILCLYLTRILYATLIILATLIIEAGFPFVPKHNTLFVLLTVGLPTVALALWARPEQLTRRALNRQLLHFVVPAGLSVFAFGLGLYLAAFSWAGAEVERSGVDPATLSAMLLRLTGMDYGGASPAQLTRELSIVTAQSVLTGFLVFSGLALIVFVEPPVSWLAGGDLPVSDRRPALMAGVLLLAYVAIVLVEPLREWFELVPLPGWVHLALVGVTLVWALLLRQAWRGCWLQRFLGLDLSRYGGPVCGGPASRQPHAHGQGVRPLSATTLPARRER